MWAKAAAAGGGMIDKLKGTEPPKGDDASYNEKQQLMDQVDIIAAGIVQDTETNINSLTDM